MEPKFEKPQLETGLTPDELEMYHISGQDKITSHSYERYLKDKADNDELIKDAQKRILEIENEPLVQRIKDGLASLNPELQIRSAKLITEAEPKDALPLLEECLKHSNGVVRNIAATMPWKIPTESGPSYTKRCLLSDDVGIFTYSVKTISGLPEESKPELYQDIITWVKKGLVSGDIEVQKVAAHTIAYLPSSEMTEFVHQCLSHPNIDVRCIGVESICLMDNTTEEKVTLLKVYVKDPDIMIQKKAISSFNSLSRYNNTNGEIPEADQTFFDQQLLENTKKCLSDFDPKIRLEAAKIIRMLPDPERTQLTLKCLSDDDREVVATAALLILVLNKNDIPQAFGLLKNRIEEWLTSGDIKRQKDAIKLIRHSSQDDREYLLDLVIRNGLGNYLVESRLYDNSVNNEVFSRVEFVKTGSELTLVGGDLMGKSVIRKIEPGPFLAWQKAYENWSIWKDHGFDYIPVEPINSFSIDGNNSLVNVHSGVLDLSFLDWSSLTQRFATEIEGQMELITTTLEKLKIEHGHPGPGNFCLRFFRNEDGTPDFTKVPRVYLIDFDRANIY